ncbi:MAG: menaquinone biosynthesis protein [Flavitalea sp.]
MSKIKVGIVNYLNTAPLVYGLEKCAVKNQIELIPDFPAKLAQSLKDGAIDIGLVPVAVIPELKEWFLVGEHCIGSDGAVASVCIFSEVPIEKIEKIYLDYQSRTSVELAKILLKEYWKISPELLNTFEGYEQKITDTTAGLVIGDRSLLQRKISTYTYDLGEVWKLHTGLPFVFAAWVSNKKLDDQFIKAFDEANDYGLNRIDEVIALHPFPQFNLHDYYTKFISYKLDEHKKQGLNRFLEFIA